MWKVTMRLVALNLAVLLIASFYIPISLAGTVQIQIKNVPVSNSVDAVVENLKNDTGIIIENPASLSIACVNGSCYNDSFKPPIPSVAPPTSTTTTPAPTTSTTTTPTPTTTTEMSTAVTSYDNATTIKPISTSTTTSTTVAATTSTTAPATTTATATATTTTQPNPTTTTIPTPTSTQTQTNTTQPNPTTTAPISTTTPTQEPPPPPPPSTAPPGPSPAGMDVAALGVVVSIGLVLVVTGSVVGYTYYKTPAVKISREFTREGGYKGLLQRIGDRVVIRETITTPFPVYRYKNPPLYSWQEHLHPENHGGFTRGDC